MLERLRLKTKMLLILGSACVAVLILLMTSAVQQRSDLIEGRKAVIRTATESAHNILSYYAAQEKSGMSHEEAQKAALAEISRIRYGGEDRKTEYLYVYQMSGINVYHVRKELIGTNVAQTLRDAQGRYPVQDLIDALKSKPDAFVDSMFPRKAGADPVPKLQYVMRFEPWDWFVGTGAWMDDVERDYRHNLMVNSGIFLLVLLVVGGLSLLISRSILRQVGGEPHVAIEVMNRAANGDLTAHVANAAPDSMMASFEVAQNAVRSIVSDIRSGSVRMRSGAEDIVAASREVAEGARGQVDATSAMAAAIEEMTVSINHISDSATDTQRNAAEAARLAGEGEEQVFSAAEGISVLSGTVDDAAARIKTLEERAGQIGSITSVIKDIAGQTNLLALNAAIEAARAGEQGRGFAVVADEVRKLAERTAHATVEIETMIASIQQETEAVTGVMQAAMPQAEEGVRLAGKAAETLRAIREGAKLALQRIGEVADATKEQSIASTSIAQRVEEIARMVEQTHARMEGSVNTAQMLADTSHDMERQVGRFQI